MILNKGADITNRMCTCAIHVVCFRIDKITYYYTSFDFGKRFAIIFFPGNALISAPIVSFSLCYRHVNESRSYV